MPEALLDARWRKLRSIAPAALPWMILIRITHVWDNQARERFIVGICVVG